MTNTDIYQDLKAEIERLRELAYTDRLTGIANRAAFEEKLAEVVADRRTYTLIYIDLDGFKAVNDGHGHEAGDAVLQNVAEVLRDSLREGDFLARLGGDEFAILTRAKDAPGLAERLATPGLPEVGLSVGVARGRGRKVLREADHRMYEQKAARVAC